MDLDKQISQFLSAAAFGVAGASEDKRKYGHKVFACYLQHGMTVYAINPNVETVLGQQCYANIASLPAQVQSVSIITPPPITETIVEDAIASGINNIWMQPGAESARAIRRAGDAVINVIAGGPCILVVLGYRE